MRRILVATAVLALIACGESETEKMPSPAQPPARPPTAAPAPQPAPPRPAPPPAPAAPTAPSPGAAAPGGAAMPSSGVVQNCLDLVRQGSFAQAVPICVQAANLEPANSEVQQALAKARAGMPGAAGGGVPATPPAGMPKDMPGHEGMPGGDMPEGDME